VLDGVGPTAGTSVFTDVAGDHTLEFYSVDVAGNREGTSTALFNVSEAPVTDTTPPVTTSDNLGAYVESATITLSATDDDSGVFMTFWRLGDDALTVGTEVHVSEYGEYKLDFFSVDNVGNVEETNTAHFSVGDAPVRDSTPPVTTSDAVASYIGTATITLTATDDLSGIMGTYYRVDDETSYTRGTLITISEEGSHTIVFFSVDVVGNNERWNTVEIFVHKDVPNERVAGDTRYETALAAASEFTTATTVVLATGEEYADALAASGLAGAYECPLLLTPRNALAGGVLDELDRLSTTDVVIVGGTAAVSAEVEAALTAAGLTVDRIAGANRYETASLIAFRIRDIQGEAFTRRAFLVRGDGFADALAVSPFSYSQGIPVLLTDTDFLSKPTSNTAAMLDFTHVTIAGGTAAVSEAAADFMDIFAGAVNRIAGIDRYQTATLMADYGKSQGWTDHAFVGFARGDAFADALAGGPVCGANEGVLLLCRTDAVPVAVNDWLAINRESVEEVRFFGGSGALSDDVVADVLAVLGD
jgi:putative cell wall-binding protein